MIKLLVLPNEQMHYIIAVNSIWGRGEVVSCGSPKPKS